MRWYSLKIKEQYKPIRTCSCGMKFLEIQIELDMGYTRTKCPWCVPYLHTGKSPELTFYGEPKTMMQENSEKILEKLRNSF